MPERGFRNHLYGHDQPVLFSALARDDMNKVENRVTDTFERLRAELGRAAMQLPPEQLKAKVISEFVPALVHLRQQIVKADAAEEALARVRVKMKELQALAEPPYQFGTFLGMGALRVVDRGGVADQEADPTGEPETFIPAIVGLNGQRYEVRIVAADLDPATLRQGQLVVLNKMMNIVGIRSDITVGETAEVINVLNPSGSARVQSVSHNAEITVNTGGTESCTIACPPELLCLLRVNDLVYVNETQILSKALPRLHVRAGASEGCVVEVSELLAQEGVAIGDIVRVDTRLQFAFEKLPAYETGALTLEEVPDVHYEDIAGLDDQISEIRDAIELPYLHRRLFDEFHLSRPKGILLHGPPGCGKTMIAKAVANSLTVGIRDHLQCMRDLACRCRDLRKADSAAPTIADAEEELRLNGVDPARLDHEIERFRGALEKEDGIRSYFMNVKGPELLNKYVGETEHRIRKVFEDAKRRASFYTPVVVFFDEMEAMFRARGSGLSSDVETTIVPQLLSEMDGVEGAENVILIGASNRPELIDAAILRPGRLDVKVKIDRPDRKAASAILALHLTPELPLEENAEVGRQRPSELTFATQVVVRAIHTLGRDLPEARRKQVIDALVPRSDVRASLRAGGALRELCEADSEISAFVDRLVFRERCAEATIQHTTSLLFHPGSRIDAVSSLEKRYTYPLHEFVGGAVLAAIVARAKKAALKRRLDLRDGGLAGETGVRDERAVGISRTDLISAVQGEFEASKEQLVAGRLDRDTGGRPGQGVETVRIAVLHLEQAETDAFCFEKVKVYRYRKEAT